MRTALCGPMHNMMHLLFINFALHITYIQKYLKYIHEIVIARLQMVQSEKKKIGVCG
jgi:hypothetical protein